MITKTIKYITLLILFCLTNLFAQIEITRNITIDDGLPYSQVTCAFKDTRGILWFGTSAGLSEWNSVEFKNFYRTDGLPSNFIKDITEDENDTLYVATVKGLVYKHGREFKSPNNLPEELHSAISKLFLAKDGTLYILTEKQGLWKKKRSNYFRIKAKEKSIIPTSIIERESGGILVGTKQNGVYSLSNESLTQIIYRKFYSNFSIVDFLDVNEKTIYIAMQGFGVVVVDSNKHHTFITTSKGLPSNQIKDLFLADDGKIYVATTNGIAVIDNGKVIKIINNKNGLTNEFVNSIFQLDVNTKLFLTEGGGIFVYHPELFTIYNKRSGLENDVIWAIKELHKGSICFLTDEGILFMQKNKISAITQQDGLGDNLLLSVYEASNGDLYLGTYADGVNFIRNGKIKRLNSKIGMLVGSVWSIVERDSTHLLFITHKNGIAVFNGEKIIDTLGVKNGLPDNQISSSLRLGDGTILIGVEYHGVYKLVGNKFVPFIDEISSNLIWSMYEDKTGNLYFGTDEQGIIRYSKEGRLDTISVSNGLSNNSVVSIVTDDFGSIYAGTDKGLNIIKYSDTKKSYRIGKFYKQSGLASSECNQNAIYKDKTGKIWVGTLEGASKINPQKINNIGNSVTAYITRFKTLTKVYYGDDALSQIILKYNENDIVIEYAGINYLSPGAISYKYKMVGLDKDWTIGTSTKIRFANLSAGTYTFMVSANNIWGTWSEPAQITFIILKPFWKTWWFFLLMLFVAIGVIYLIMNYRLKNIIRLEKLRTKISADLHDEIGSGLSEISILSELLKYNKVFDQKLLDGLDKIGDSTRQLIESLSDIIWIVNPRKETLKDLIFRIEDTYHEVFYRSDISFSISQIEKLDNVTLPLETRQNLYLIIKEAVNNSLKYSNCNSIEINVNTKKGLLFIEVTDDGIGLEESDYTKGNGLYNMKKRAEQINGKIKITGNSNGTKITIEIYTQGKTRK